MVGAFETATAVIAPRIIARLGDLLGAAD